MSKSRGNSDGQVEQVIDSSICWQVVSPAVGRCPVTIDNFLRQAPEIESENGGQNQSGPV
ncbi:hypothetical protein RE6C_02330 [Rhodopirellula europaea 6C]|uniref:Uncharacterized protein n=1 Tax=Rhodopirellula europaea 6C TaxID=1263867 RepID=M2AW58_9BACT|nr:hypothetical protein RE6C_02330 [Rhodopirellula europaea 6C]